MNSWYRWQILSHLPVLEWQWMSVLCGILKNYILILTNFFKKNSSFQTNFKTRERNLFWVYLISTFVAGWALRKVALRQVYQECTGDQVNLEKTREESRTKEKVKGRYSLELRDPQLWRQDDRSELPWEWRGVEGQAKGKRRRRALTSLCWWRWPWSGTSLVRSLFAWRDTWRELRAGGLFSSQQTSQKLGNQSLIPEQESGQCIMMFTTIRKWPVS